MRKSVIGNIAVYVGINIQIVIKGTSEKHHPWHKVVFICQRAGQNQPLL